MNLTVVAPMEFLMPYAEMISPCSVHEMETISFPLLIVSGFLAIFAFLVASISAVITQGLEVLQLISTAYRRRLAENLFQERALQTAKKEEGVIAEDLQR